ncbi:MAG TPA: hypothetical protein PK252_04485 [Bacteroidales bacterium]|nr:hypothetical protein [Bacteroidales bacterium]
MFEKKTTFKSPDLGELQEVKIDFKTKIYIPLGKNPEEAKRRILEREAEKSDSIAFRKKPVTA